MEFEFSDFRMSSVAQTGNEALFKIDREDDTSLIVANNSAPQRLRVDRLDMESSGISPTDLTQQSDELSVDVQTQSLDVAGSERIPTVDIVGTFKKQYCSNCCKSWFSNHDFAGVKFELKEAKSKLPQDVLEKAICTALSHLAGEVLGPPGSQIAKLSCEIFLGPIEELADGTRFTLGVIDVDSDWGLATLPKISPWVAPGFYEDADAFRVSVPAEVPGHIP